jgi:hypothetical protein
MHANAPHFSPSASGADVDLSPGDLGPLAWVMEELRKSLEAASTALRRHVREGWTTARGPQGGVDTQALSKACAQLHQGQREAGGKEEARRHEPVHEVQPVEQRRAAQLVQQPLVHGVALDHHQHRAAAEPVQRSKSFRGHGGLEAS